MSKSKYFLVDAQKMSKKYPKRFWYASKKELRSLTLGDSVKVCINNMERVWLKIVDMDFNKPIMQRRFTGTLGNSPVFAESNLDDLIEFQAKHIYTYTTQEEIRTGKGWL